MNLDQLAPDEPLSPELVLVFSPESRAQALAYRPAPVWPLPRLRVVESPAPSRDARFTRFLGGMVVARVTQLALVFAAVTMLTLAMSLVANAMR